MSKTERRKLLILGSGPAGCTAAIYAARANLQPALFTGLERGGQLTTTTEVENWPGGSADLQGPQLMENLLEHAGRLGVEIIDEHIEHACLDERPFQLKSNDATYCCDALIIATGASARYLGLPDEQRFLGRGVSACATCDGFFFRDRPVAVVGGGNTAAEEALYLSRLASEVTVVHRRDRLRADKTLQQRLFARQKEGKLKLAWNSVLKKIEGDDSGLTSMVLQDVNSGTETRMGVDGVFIAIGHTPNTQLLRGKLDMDSDGYLKTRSGLNGNASACSIPGVFAAGDVSDSIYRQAITSAGSGCIAALDAEKYLDSLDDH